jgi:hypothetical protein
MKVKMFIMMTEAREMVAVKNKLFFRDKHSSLFHPTVSNEGKNVYNDDGSSKNKLFFSEKHSSLFHRTVIDEDKNVYNDNGSKWNGLSKNKSFFRDKHSSLFHQTWAMKIKMCITMMEASKTVSVKISNGQHSSLFCPTISDED